MATKNAERDERGLEVPRVTPAMDADVIERRCGLKAAPGSLFRSFRTKPRPRRHSEPAA